MVRVLAVSDEVAPTLPETAVHQLQPDLVLGAGDLPWDYLELLASSLDVPVAFVPGNHDPEISRAKLGSSGLFLNAGRIVEPPGPQGVINVDGRVVELEGLRIAGLGGSVRYRQGPHQYTQQQFARRARKLRRLARRRGPIDILLTHAPPKGLGDGEDKPHEGINALHQLVATIEPAWLLHGHIHPFGMPKPDRFIGNTTVRNVIPWKLIEIETKDDRDGT